MHCTNIYLAERAVPLHIYVYIYVYAYVYVYVYICIYIHIRLCISSTCYVVCKEGRGINKDN